MEGAAAPKGWEHLIEPHFWDGTDWSPAEDHPTQEVDKKRLTVVSYNVWFGSYLMRQRMAALGELIASYDPDLVALQEVTAEINSVLLDQVRFISFWQLL